MRKFIIALLFIFTGIFNTSAFYPVTYDKVNNEEVELINNIKSKEDASLELDINMDEEEIKFFAKNKIVCENITYVIGSNKQVKVIAFTNNQLKLILNNNKIITINNIKINERLKEDIDKLPNA